MRKLIVCNMVSLDGFYEGKDRSLGALFHDRHEDYAHDDSFDFYNAERLRAADLLLLSGRVSFIGFKDYWAALPGDPSATAIRREIAGLMSAIEKAVVSDSLSRDALPPCKNTRIIRRADAHLAGLRQHCRPLRGGPQEVISRTPGGRASCCHAPFLAHPFAPAAPLR